MTALTQDNHKPALVKTMTTTMTPPRRRYQLQPIPTNRPTMVPSSPLAKKPKKTVLSSLRQTYIHRGSPTPRPEDQQQQQLPEPRIALMPALHYYERLHCPYDDEEENDDRPRSLSFMPHVQVVEIPSRHDYPPWMAERLWNGRKQIRAAAVRNAAEFAYEGGNWRQAVEEMDFMIIRHALVHPAHVHRQAMRQQHRMMMKAAPEAFGPPTTAVV